MCFICENRDFLQLKWIFRKNPCNSDGKTPMDHLSILLWFSVGWSICWWQSKNINFWVKIDLSKIWILSPFVVSKLCFGLKLAPIVIFYHIQAKKLSLAPWIRIWNIVEFYKNWHFLENVKFRLEAIFFLKNFLQVYFCQMKELLKAARKFWKKLLVSDCPALKAGKLILLILANPRGLDKNQGLNQIVHMEFWEVPTTLWGFKCM